MRYARLNITKAALVVIVISSAALFTNCEREKPVYPVPSIQFITGAGYLSGDTMLLLNDTVVIGISAKTESDKALTLFHTTIAKDSAIVTIDTALYTHHFEYRKMVVKGIADQETWTFYVRDRDGRQSAAATLILKLDPASLYHNIRYVPSIILGAQNCSQYGSFYSLAGNHLFFPPEAFGSQEMIDLVYYYDFLETDKNTLASPGANIDASVFTGPAGLANWAIKNTTRFVFQDNLTSAEFDACRNDSLILANSFEFAVGKRKAKNLANGQVYSFMTESGIRGLFKIKAVRGEDAGDVEISIKMLQ